MQLTLPGILASQNPWWASPAARAAGAFPLRRTEFASLRDHLLSQGPQVMLVGPRQAGKTVLLWQLVDSLLDERTGERPAWDPRQIVHFNFQDERLGYPVPLLRDVVEAHAATYPETNALPCVYLFDEVGRSPNWDASLKHLHSEALARAAAPRRYIVTDSAALLVDDALAVAGRFDRYRLAYLTFPDFVALRRAQGRPMSATSLELVVGPEFDAYLERGGSPANLFISDAGRVRQHVREATQQALIQDLLTLTGPGRTAQAAALFAALAADSGVVLNATARGRDVSVTRQTVEKWIGVMIQTGLLLRVEALSRSARERSTLQPRLYCSDPGIVAAYSIAPAPMVEADSRGRIVETAVLVHLHGAADRLRARLGYGVGKSESDFLLETTAGTLVIQVTAGRNTNAKDAWTAARAARAVPRGIPLVVSRHPTQQVHDVEGTKVREVPAWSLCQRLASAAAADEVIDWAKP